MKCNFIDASVHSEVVAVFKSGLKIYLLTFLSDTQLLFLLGKYEKQYR